MNLKGWKNGDTITERDGEYKNNKQRTMTEQEQIRLNVLRRKRNIINRLTGDEILELKELERQEFRENREAYDICPDCLETKHLEELQMFNGLCEECYNEIK